MSSEGKTESYSLYHYNARQMTQQAKREIQIPWNF